MTTQRTTNHTFIRTQGNPRRTTTTPIRRKHQGRRDSFREDRSYDDNRRFYEDEMRNCHICGRGIHGNSGIVSDGMTFCGVHCRREYERQRMRNIMMWVSIAGGAVVLLVLLAHPEILLIPALLSIGGGVLFGKAKKR